MKFSGYTVLIYGLFVLTGGLIGFLKANSLPSLIMGASFGIGLMVSGRAILRNSLFSVYIAIGLAFILTVFFGYRFLNSSIFMPSGLMVLLSFMTLIALFVGNLKKKLFSKTS